MMCETRTPHTCCGLSREWAWRRLARGALRARVFALIALLSISSSNSAFAQDPNVVQSSKPPSSFAGQGSIFGNVNKKLDQSQPMNVQGDQLIYESGGQRVVARGNVEIFYNDYILTADEVVYDQSAGTLTAVGNVTLKEPQGNVVHADRYTLTDDFRDGFVQSLSIVAKDETRISAERATRREGNITEFQKGKFTPCKTVGDMPPLWCLSAASIIHDKEAATLTYQDAYFEIFGQPILYLPYFQSPDPSVKRKSGILAPELGNSSTLGYITGLPYYYVLAPNADATITPVYLSNQGLLLKGEFRHRLENGEYTIDLAGIDQNGADLPGTAAEQQALDGLRGSVETKGLFSLSSWWKFGWDVIVESDDQFRRFYKLDSILVTDRVNQIFLTGQSDRNYFNATLYQFGGLLLNSTAQTESYTHPIIDYNYVFADPVFGGELKWDTNFLSFTRQDGVRQLFAGGVTRDQDINRLTTEVKWRRRLTDQVGITYTPFANLRGDVYQYNNFTNPQSVSVDPVTGAVTASTLTADDTTVRGVAAGGLTVAYPWVAHTAGASHVIEPIGQIIARQQNLAQRNLPDEDARSLVFDDTNLFEVSKFSGFDRTEVGTRVNAGLQYTFQAYDGGYARFLFGESFHLSGDNVYANPGRDDDGRFVYSPVSGLQTDRSDYVLGAYIAPTEAFRVISQSRFDQADFSLRREDLAAQVLYGPLFASASYAFTAAEPQLGINTEQQDIYGLLLLRLTDFWSIGAGARYDIDAEQLLQDSFQLKYSDACLVLTATYSEVFFNNATITDDRTLLLRVEFKHLGDFQYRTNALDFNFGADQRVN